MQIDVNGTKHDVPAGEITYEMICDLAGKPGAQGLTVVYVVYHWHGEGDVHRSGTIYKGKSVAGADGMHFTAVFTGNA